ncbi:hypothetical protein [Halomonas salipaludis]|uniref:Uncharacterized protein n=1 Tax=Halomonas salipaludis TaxID=2032625 RepID=A0A2A2EXM3_9GAMM|nr:hypothetical protein [Halomonas salipaludis]PAU77119.1 hypothetical protein CK498_07640 [Halomonas salipaludis]
MRLIPWLTTVGLTAALMLGTTTLVHADEAMSDAELEEEYGIKAGSLVRDDDDGEARDEDASTNDSGNDEEEAPEAGTGGSGSAEDAHDGSEEE